MKLYAAFNFDQGYYNDSDVLLGVYSTEEAALRVCDECARKEAIGWNKRMGGKDKYDFYRKQYGVEVIEVDATYERKRPEYNA